MFQPKALTTLHVKLLQAWWQACLFVATMLQCNSLPQNLAVLPDHFMAPCVTAYCKQCIVHGWDVCQHDLQQNLLQTVHAHYPCVRGGGGEGAWWAGASMEGIRQRGPSLQYPHNVPVKPELVCAYLMKPNGVLT